MLGTIVNTIAVLIGGCIGLLLKKGLPQRLADILMKALGLCTLLIGITGVMGGKRTLLVILSMVLGTLLGEGIDLDKRINTLGRFIESKCKRTDGKTTIAEGFVSASLLFCVGAMTIVGALQSGLTGNHIMLFTKSMLDCVAAMIFASTLGIGVLFAAAFVFVYQGAITLLAQWVAPYLSDAVVNEMTVIGSLLIIGLGVNMLGIAKLKVINFVPAIFLPVALCPFFDWISSLTGFSL